MAEINTNVWGEQEDWVDVSSYYEDNQAPLKDRIQWASYDGEHDNIYGFIHGAETLEPNTPIDNSISYCGLGFESPLSHITYFRGQQGYSYRFRDGNVPWTSAEANTQEETIKDDRTRTNFALSRYDLGDGEQKNISKQYFDTNQLTDYFHQGWGPLSVIDTITDTTSIDFKYNPTLRTKIPVRLPIKNMVAIPYVRALANVGVENPDPITVDLKTYLDTTSQYNYTNHPYMYQVYMTICSDPSGVKETGISRSVDPGFNQLMLLEDISMWKGMPSGTYELHQYGDVITDTNIDYSHIISYNGQSGIPILGNLIGSWNKRYSGCEPKGDGESSDWDLHELDWWSWDDFEGHGDAGNGGPECFAWAGPDPSIAWWEPNGSDYEKQTNYKRFVYRQITDADEFLEEVRSAVACFGLFFVDGEEDKNVALDDNKMMLGILVDGIGHGDYSHGKANRDQDQWNMDDAHEVDFDPNQPAPEPPGPEPDPNPIEPETPGFTLAVDSGSVCYVITKAEWNQIWNDIYGGSKSNWKDLIDGLALYGSNPLNCILNYRWYPFEIATQDSAPLRLGSTVVQPDTHRYHKISYQNESFKSATATFWAGRAKNFVESKKTKCRVFLPFYGYYELPMSLMMKKELGVQFQYDLPNDTGIWFIMFGGSIYDWVECSPYIEIPITGDNSLQIAAAKAQRNLQIAMAVGGAVIGVATGVGVAGGAITSLAEAGTEAAWAFGGSKLAGALASGPLLAEEGLLAGLGSGAAIASGAIGAGAAKTASSVYNTALQVGTLSTNVPVHSAASDTTFLSLKMYPYVQFFQNDMQQSYDAAGYKKSTGIACNCWKTIAEMDKDSLLKVSTPVLNDYSNMEASEIEALHAALVAGFYP